MFTTFLSAKTSGVREISGQHQNALRLVSAYLCWRLRRRRWAELCDLSDRTLKDIGIYRTEIGAIVNSPNRDASGRVR